MVKASVVRYMKFAAVIGILCFLYLIIRSIFFTSLTFSEVDNLQRGSDQWFNDPAAFASVIAQTNRTKTRGQDMCGGQMTVYAYRFALLVDVIIDPSKATGKPGGETIDTVMNQPEKLEYFQYMPGYFQLQCPGNFNKYQKNNVFYLGHRNHLNNYMASVRFVDKLPLTPVFQPANRTVFAITRYEYVNFYHTMTDLYNVYFNCRFLGISPETVHILFIDGHPKGSLDAVWQHLFAGFTYAGHLQNPVRFPELVWATMGYLSPLMQHKSGELPLADDFREYFLSRFNVSRAVINRLRKCSTGISILFVWRRDYLAHPRNPTGKVVRKIKNEQELLDYLSKVYPKSIIKSVGGIQLDVLPMKVQLEHIAQTDILIGMHGAGLTHALFLAPHSALVEFYPRYWSQGNKHFNKIAQWRSLIYERWVNKDMRNEKSGHYTYVPPSIVANIVRKILHKMNCLQAAPNT